MPPFSVGLAQVESRLGSVRRRRNLVTVQDAIYRSGSLIALAAALIVGVAVRGRATVFAIALWCAGAAAVSATAAAIIRVRRRWLSPDEIVRFADRQGSMDDRLATLLLDRSRAGASRLKDLLLEQVLAAAPRWDVDALAPRRVPRSAYALLAALVILIATSFLVRSPATPLSTADARQDHPGDRVAQRPRPESGIPAVGGVGTVIGGGSGAQRAGSAGRGQGGAGNRAGGMMASSNELANTGNDGAPATTTLGGTQDGSSSVARGGPGAAREPAASTAGEQRGGMTASLQSSIREALGASSQPPTDGQPAGRQPQTSMRGAPTDPTSASASARAGGAGQSPRSGTRERATSPDDDTNPALPGTGSTAAGQPGQTAGELLGQQPQARLGGEVAASMPLKLGAFAALHANQIEPQRRPPTEALPGDYAAAAAPPPLSEEQIPDAPLQKAEVAPEHEAVVRQIFTRE